MGQDFPSLNPTTTMRHQVALGKPFSLNFSSPEGEVNQGLYRFWFSSVKKPHSNHVMHWVSFCFFSSSSDGQVLCHSPGKAVCITGLQRPSMRVIIVEFSPLLLPCISQHVLYFLGSMPVN